MILKTEHCDIPDLPGGGWSLTSKRKQIICHISGLKSGRSRLRNKRSGLLRGRVWTSVWVKNKMVIYKVAPMRELTVIYLLWFEIIHFPFGDHLISFLNVFLDYVSMLWGESCWTFFSDPSDRSADYMESLQWSFQMSINLPLPYFMSPLVLVVVYLMNGPTWLTPYGYNKTVIINSCLSIVN